MCVWALRKLRQTTGLITDEAQVKTMRLMRGCGRVKDGGGAGRAETMHISVIATCQPSPQLKEERGSWITTVEIKVSSFYHTATFSTMNSLMDNVSNRLLVFYTRCKGRDSQLNGKLRLEVTHTSESTQ